MEGADGGGVDKGAQCGFETDGTTRAFAVGEVPGVDLEGKVVGEVGGQAIVHQAVFGDAEGDDACWVGGGVWV